MKGIIQVFKRKDKAQLRTISQLGNTGLKFETGSQDGEWTVAGGKSKVNYLLKYLDKNNVYYETTFDLPTVEES